MVICSLSSITIIAIPGELQYIFAAFELVRLVLPSTLEEYVDRSVLWSLCNTEFLPLIMQEATKWHQFGQSS